MHRSSCCTTWHLKQGLKMHKCYCDQLYECDRSWTPLASVNQSSMMFRREKATRLDISHGQSSCAVMEEWLGNIVGKHCNERTGTTVAARSAVRSTSVAPLHSSVAFTVGTRRVGRGQASIRAPRRALIPLTSVTAGFRHDPSAEQHVMPFALIESFRIIVITARIASLPTLPAVRGTQSVFPTDISNNHSMTWIPNSVWRVCVNVAKAQQCPSHETSALPLKIAARPNTVMRKP